MAAAEHTFGPYVQGEDVTIQITLKNADYPQSGSVWRMRAEPVRNPSGVFNSTATLATLVDGDALYESGTPKYSATWTFAHGVTRLWTIGKYTYQIEHVRGGIETVTVKGAFTVERGLNVDG